MQVITEFLTFLFLDVHREQRCGCHRHGSAPWSWDLYNTSQTPSPHLQSPQIPQIRCDGLLIRGKRGGGVG